MAYEYDHDCPFEAYITNLGKYNEGELVGEWVKFPTTSEDLKKVFERIGIGSKDDFGNPYEEWFISDYDCYVDGLYELLGICVAYKKQPEVSNTTKKEIKNESWNECSENTERAVIIEKNPEALLQRVRLIRNAKEDIILSTFAFQSDESGKLILGALHDAADRSQILSLPTSYYSNAAQK